MTGAVMQMGMINTEIGSMGAGIDQSIVDNIASDTVFPPLDGEDPKFQTTSHSRASSTTSTTDPLEDSTDDAEEYTSNDNNDSTFRRSKSEKVVGILSSEATAKRRHSMPAKQFGFSTVTIREYPRALGDNITVMGPPVSLDWEHQDETVYDLIEYDEAVSDTRRKMPELKMPSKLRDQILRESGYTKQDIQKATKASNIARQQRKRTVEMLKLQPLHEAFEKMTRFGKKKTDLMTPPRHSI